MSQKVHQVDQIHYKALPVQGAFYAYIGQIPLDVGIHIY